MLQYIQNNLLKNIGSYKRKSLFSSNNDETKEQWLLFKWLLFLFCFLKSTDKKETIIITKMSEAEGETAQKKVIKARPKDKQRSMFDFELILHNGENKLTIRGRDIYSKRLFVATFNQEKLILCGFHPKQTLPQIIEILEVAINETDVKAIKLSIGLQNNRKQSFFFYTLSLSLICRKQSESKKKGFTTGNEVNLRSEYQSGDKLCLGIEHNVQLYKMSYGLLLSEISQTEVQLLQEIVKDLRVENQQLREEVTKTTNDFHKFKEESQKQKNWKLVIGIQVQTVGIIGMFLLHSIPFFRSKTIFEKVGVIHIQCIYSNRLWNVCILNTAADTFELQSNQKDLTIKKAGVYRLQASVSTYGQTNKSAQLQINGGVVAMGYSYTSGTNEYQQITLNHVARLQVNAVVAVYTYQAHNTQTCNSLIIERLSD
ncbi:hypothetical protein RFI_00412 [Reticulomyxa filosa]|uniref:Uncharacterized protein n=1 Tax=Reticulomyxa filosa TaxID=46433 RepID=X6PEW6_RETFI|nr:hypothetical protein RFI_00412 [Reticulomyxa filosa]|eukprot:ETO36648.1 hypothetical protein RFI_00412 [Reticulomyxa filosa]